MSSDAVSPPVSDNDKGSPGMLGAATSTDVEHITDPTKPVDVLQRQAILPPDIGGGD
ncbi:MAG TPA: hypothetical protein VGO93_10025 [Candidatus Xenobia bacterium]|jgi:hypothetical protein